MLRAINVITAAGALVLIAMSLWPGFAGGCFFVLALPLIGLLGVTWVLVASYSFPRPWGLCKPLSSRQVMFAPALVCITLAVLFFYVPRRIAFLVCKAKFENYVVSAPGSDHDGVVLDQTLGIYHVDRYATDPRGGTFFRTGTAPDGLGPDTMSFGFAYRPNRIGTPFGHASYVVRHLSGDWYWFAVSDD